MANKKKKKKKPTNNQNANKPVNKASSNNSVSNNKQSDNTNNRIDTADSKDEKKIIVLEDNNVVFQGLDNESKEKAVSVNTAEETAKSRGSFSKEGNDRSFPKKVITVLGLKTKTDYVILMIGTAIIIVLLVLAIMLFCGVFQTKESGAATVSYYGRDESDMSASLISSTEEEQRMMSDEMELDFDNPKFDFYSLTDYEYSDASTIIPLSLSNPSYNKYVLVFTITDGEGEILYRSLGVRPGYVVTYVGFSRNIPYGENDLKMYVTAFKEKDGKNGEKKYSKVGNSIATLKMIHTATQEAETN